MDVWVVVLINPRCNITKKGLPDSGGLLILALLPEVGTHLDDETFFYPAIYDGLHYWRLVVGEAEVHQIFLRDYSRSGNILFPRWE